MQGVGLLFQEASLSCLVFFLFFLSFWTGIFSSLLSFVSLVVDREGKRVFFLVLSRVCLLAWSLCLCFSFFLLTFFFFPSELR